jgi:hypothetical protein
MPQPQEPLYLRQAVAAAALVDLVIFKRQVFLALLL